MSSTNQNFFLHINEDMPRRTQAQILVDDAATFIGQPTGARQERAQRRFMKRIETMEQEERRRERQRERYRRQRDERRRVRISNAIGSMMGSYPFLSIDVAFGGAWRKFRSRPFESKRYDYNEWVSSHFQQSKRSMTQELSRSVNFKVFGRAKALYFRFTDLNEIELDEAGNRIDDRYRQLVQQWGPNVPFGAGDIMESIHVPIKQEGTQSIITNSIDIVAWLSKFNSKLITDIERTISSEWQFWRGEWVEHQYSQYNAIAGASHVKLPQFISKKAAVINIQNKDERCLEYALICGLHYDEMESKKNAERTSKYREWMGTLNFDGIEFPVKTDGKDIAKIEKMNDLCINVYALRDEECTKDTFRKNLFLLYQSKKDKKAIQLFFYKNHYMYIHNWKAFTNRDGEHHFYCPNCLTSHRCQETLDKHLKQCNKIEPLNTSMPTEDSILRFKKWNTTMRHPVGCYCDFEAFNHSAVAKGVRENGVLDMSSGEKPLPKDVKFEQTAASCGMFLQCDIPLSIPSFYSLCKQGDSDDIHMMVTKKIREVEKTVRFEVFDDEKPQPSLTHAERKMFNQSTRCPHCKYQYNSERWCKKAGGYETVMKVEDHDHRTGKFRGDLCSKCNLDLGKIEKKQGRFINFYFHNLKGYDMHHIIQALAKDDVEFERIKCIPKNGEQYTTFSWKPLPCEKEEYLRLKKEHDYLKNLLQSKKGSKEEKEEWRTRKSEINEYLESPLEIRFIDTMAFLNAGIESLLNNLPDDAKLNLKTMACDPDGNFSADRFEMVKRKGDFPYEWFDHHSKLRATSLPTFDHWSSRLRRAFLKDESKLQKLQETWNFFGFKTFKDWHDHYLEIDVKGLADVFENFRVLCLDIYGVDPAFYFTAPGMFNDALYKYTGAKVELISDVDMYNFMEAGIRGGLSVQANRYSRANNKYMRSHDITQKSKYILYTDANNLYGWAMKQALPYREYQWEDVNSRSLDEWDAIARDPSVFQEEWLKAKNSKFQEMHHDTCFPDNWGQKQNGITSRVAGKSFREVLQNHSDYVAWAVNESPCKQSPLHVFKQYILGVTLEKEESVGCTFEVDLEYPIALHDDHNDYPCAPESMEISNAELRLSSYAASKMQSTKKLRVPCRKLCATLHDKKNYIVHWRALQLYLRLGLKVTKVHRVVSYIQKPWMKSYIELNEGNRKKSKNDFEKDFFKLANNSVFGKQMENVRQRFRPLVWVTSREAFLKEVSKPCYHGNCIKYSESLLSLQHKQTDVKLNKPIQVGQAILDISKVCMFEFHYDVMLKHFGLENLKLLMTDTDSLVYEISSKDPNYDLYADLSNVKEHFDFSDYPDTHPLYSTDNKKIAGKFKDDKATLITEFCGIRAKMYSLQMACSEEITASNDMEALVGDFEVGKAKKGFVSGVKTLSYLKNNEDGELVKAEERISAYESLTTKGIKKSIATAELRHHHFKDCLLRNMQAPKVHIPSLRSVNHRIFMFDQEKVSLDPLDDKRHALGNGVNTLAHGHCAISTKMID